jgi:hypothetical protein
MCLKSGGSALLDSKKGAKIRRKEIIVWNQDDKIIQRGNNRGTRKTPALLWENHFTGYYLQKNYCAWLYGEDSMRFWADGSLSQCLKKDICNVREIGEDAGTLSVSPDLIYPFLMGYIPETQSIRPSNREDDIRNL